MQRNWIKIIFIGGLLILTSLIQADQIPELTLNDSDRVLVLAPHPDDEVLGVGGVLLRTLTKKLPVKVVFLTYGDSNPWSFMLYRKHPVVMPGAVKKMGLIRREEAEHASNILGVESQNLIFLGYPDFGTMNIWYSHWDDRPPLRAMMTFSNKVPYQGAFRPGAMYKGEEIVADLRSVIRDFNPTKIFVSHPADHNGDHLALYLFLRIALWDEQLQDKVKVYPYLIHYLGWPKPKGFIPQLALTPPKTLDNSIDWKQLTLSPQEFVLKKAALLAHKSQYKSTPKYLLSFIRPNELFGDFNSIKLHVNEEYSVFKIQKRVVPSAEFPDEFNDKERSSFVGIDWKFVRWEGNDLIISIELSKSLASDVEASVYIFGYSPTTSFTKMPKINVRLGVFSYNVFNQNKKLSQKLIDIKYTDHIITIKVPLKLLGNPDRILTSARTYLGNVPLDSASWVAVQLD